MADPEQIGLDKSINAVQTPENLREFLNNGAIYDLAYRLRLANNGEHEESFSIREDESEFKVYWLHQARKRLLVVQNSLSRLPGLFLSLPVELNECKTAPGEIAASYIPIGKDNEFRVPEPYSEGMVTVGSPQAVVKIMVVAGQELSIASGILPAEDI